jgi:hypothetical protein
LSIFAITRLFAHHKNWGMGSAFAKNNLRCIPIQIASLAAGGRLSQAREVVPRRQEL